MFTELQEKPTGLSHILDQFLNILNSPNETEAVKDL